MVHKKDKDMDKAEVIVFLSVLPILILVFIEHDEFFMLFMLELSFIAIMGIICAVMAICLMYAVKVVGCILDHIKGENNADTQEKQ